MLKLASPLADDLCRIDGVTEVLMSADDVTVNVASQSDWETIGPQVHSILNERLAGGVAPPVDLDLLAELGSVVDGSGGGGWAEDSVEYAICETLEERIRPFVRDDGGDITFRGFDPADGTARVQLVGACSGCPSAAAPSPWPWRGGGGRSRRRGAT